MILELECGREQNLLREKESREKLNAPLGI